MHRMFIGVDASGSFNVEAAPPGRPGVVAAVAVSKRHYDEVRGYVEGRCLEWNLPELHAIDLRPEQRGEVCRWIGEGERLVWTAGLTDSRLFPFSRLLKWRQDQADQLSKAVEGRPTDEIETVLTNRDLSWHLARIRHGEPLSLPTPHFVEFLFVLPRVIGDAAQASINAYDGSAWADEFNELSIRIDDSSAKDAKAQVKDLLKLILAGPALALRPPPRSGLNHPFFAKHRREGRSGDLRTLIGDRIKFVASEEEPLCQLADMIAWVVRRRAAQPVERGTADLYQHLRRRQHGVEGSRGVRVMSMKGSPEDAPDRYRHVAALTRWPVPERKEPDLMR